MQSTSTKEFLTTRLHKIFTRFFSFSGVNPAPISTSYKSLNQRNKVEQHFPENWSGVNLWNLVVSFFLFIHVFFLSYLQWLMIYLGVLCGENFPFSHGAGASNVKISLRIRFKISSFKPRRVHL